MNGYSAYYLVHELELLCVLFEFVIKFILRTI